MKKLIIVTIAMVAAAATTWAGGVLQSDGLPNTPGRAKIQGFAPNGKKSQALTVNRSGTITLSGANGSAAWGVYAPADCSFRIQSTATRAGLVQTAPGGTWTIRVVNENSPFVSYSGCTSGQLQLD